MVIHFTYHSGALHHPERLREIWKVLLGRIQNGKPDIVQVEESEPWMSVVVVFDDMEGFTIADALFQKDLIGAVFLFASRYSI